MFPEGKEFELWAPCKLPKLLSNIAAILSSCTTQVKCFALIQSNLELWFKRKSYFTQVSKNQNKSYYNCQ